MRDKVLIWHAKDGWRWRRIAPNSEQVAESGEAYTRKEDAEIAAMRAQETDYDIIFEG